MMDNWFAKQRQLWIDETLRVFGFINRCHLMRKFEISEPQASKDLNVFMQRNPGRMVYDKTGKCYREDLK